MKTIHHGGRKPLEELALYSSQHSFICTISWDMQKADVFFIVMRISVLEKAKDLPKSYRYMWTNLKIFYLYAHCYSIILQFCLGINIWSKINTTFQGLAWIIWGNWFYLSILIFFFIKKHIHILSSFLCCYREQAKWCMWNPEQTGDCHPKEKKSYYDAFHKVLLYHADDCLFYNISLHRTRELGNLSEHCRQQRGHG